MEFYGYAHLSQRVTDVAGLRALIAWLDRHGIPDDAPVDTGNDPVVVVLADTEQITMTLCGECSPDAHDCILAVHPCLKDIDRYGEEARPE